MNHKLLMGKYFDVMVKGVIALWGPIMKGKPTVAALAFVTAVLFWMTVLFWVFWVVLK